MCGGLRLIEVLNIYRLIFKAAVDSLPRIDINQIIEQVFKLEDDRGQKALHRVYTLIPAEPRSRKNLLPDGTPEIVEKAWTKFSLCDYSSWPTTRGLRQKLENTGLKIQ